jgi:hypothetical protein
MLLIEFDFIFIDRWYWGYLIYLIWAFRVIFNQWKIISFFILVNVLNIIKRVVLHIYILVIFLFIITILFTFLFSLLRKISMLIFLSLFKWLNLSLLQLNSEIFWFISWHINYFTISLGITIINEAQKVYIFWAVYQLICLSIN